MYFKIFESYNVLLAISTNIPVLLMTAFVLLGRIFVCTVYIYYVYIYILFFISIFIYTCI